MDHRDDAPFDVLSHAARIRVTGTRFNVYRHATFTDVDLLQGGVGAGHGNHGERPAARPAGSAPEAAVDPVGGEAVRTVQALTCVYEGKIYYFASKENRDRFEAAPQDYAHKAAGHPVRAAEAANERPRRRGGC